MSKKKNSPAGTRPAPAKPASSRTSRVELWPVTSESDPMLKRVFQILAVLMFVVMAGVAVQTGINGDDEYQYDYSEKLVSYYSSFGKDTAALFIEKGNMHNYGGFFDLLAGTLNATLGNEVTDQAYHNTRHVLISVFGAAAMVFAGLLAAEIAGWQAGIIALLLAFFSPRFFGHALMNPKDIPFAAGFAMATYFMVKMFKSLPGWSWKNTIGLVVGISIAIATRAGGLLLIGYLGLFAGLDFLIKYGVGGLTKQANQVARYAWIVTGVTVSAYLLAVLAWPAALADPLGHPFRALSEFSQLGIKIRLLFQGENVMSDKTPWYYPVTWIVKTIPFSVLSALVALPLMIPIFLRRFQALPVLLTVFGALFPVGYVIYKDSILHDGWRHLMFVYPSMVVLAALFWTAMQRMLGARISWGKYAIWGLLTLTTIDSAAFMVRNPTLSYVYFNPLGGGLKGAFGHYETDYWGVSVKSALDWMEEKGILHDQMKDTITIGTTFYYPVFFQTAGKYKGMVKTVYVRFGQRYSEAWDYGIFPSRFFRGPHLQEGTWPNSKAIHVVKANGVPIAAVEKDATKAAWRGEQAAKAQDWPGAIEEFEAELKQHKDNELAWLGLSNALLNTGKFSEAADAAEESLKIAPKNEQGLFQKGLALVNSGNMSGAAEAFEQNIAVNEESYFALYYLAIIYQQTGDADRALRNILRALEINPRFKQAYELAAALYEQKGDAQSAAAYRNAAAQL